jgi:glutathione synthase/RimK-type ligase-like ATP-grasp enzyme
LKHLQLFEQFINEAVSTDDSALNKAYLVTKRNSGQRWLSYKGFAGNKFFTQITENNKDKITINPDYPVLNYQSDLVNQLIKEGKIKEENVYNKPKDIKLSGSKKEFHKLVEGDDAIPKTVFSKANALDNLKFPIIAKPAEGHSGLGIQIFDKPELLESADEKLFDTYSEFVDKAEEHRFMNFSGKPILWMVRTPYNNKAKTGKGDADEEMSFKYQRRDVKDIPADYAKVLKRFCKIYEKFPFICFDVMKGKDGKVYVIESNAQPGVPFDSTVEMYKGIYEDFYKKPIDSKSMKLLDSYSEDLIKKTLEKDKVRFS